MENAVLGKLVFNEAERGIKMETQARFSRSMKLNVMDPFLELSVR